MFFLKHRVVDDSYIKITEKIKKDLLLTFRQKGIDISKIQIDMKSDNLNLKVCIEEKLNSAM